MNEKLELLEYKIQRLAEGDNTVSIPAILEQMLSEINRLDNELKRIGKTAARAANEASCLANGIQPD